MFLFLVVFLKLKSQSGLDEIILFKFGISVLLKKKIEKVERGNLGPSGEIKIE